MASIEAAMRSGFRAYKQRIIAPTPSVTPSRNVLRAADFTRASSTPSIAIRLSILNIPLSGNLRNLSQQFAEKVIFRRLLKHVPAFAEAPAPPARLLEAGLRAGRQMQVEPCEIPFAGAPETFCRERIYAFPTLYAATTKGLAPRQGKRRRCLPAGRQGHFSATC
jgi:hypothetical protein